MTALGLLAVAGLLLIAARHPVRRGRSTTRPAARPVEGQLARLRAARRRALPGARAWRAGRAQAPDVGSVISEVATRLRSGAPVELAWSAAVDRVLGPPAGSDRHVSRHPPGRPPDPPSEPLPAGLVRLAERCRGDPAAEAAALTVAAATRLSRATGAPLADALDRCVETVVEAERAHDARSVALAGPRSTARILTGLPLLGLVLGAGLGADPVGTALDGGWGTVSVACGAVLLYAGARWSAALVRAAAEPVTGARSGRRRGAGRIRGHGPGAGVVG